MKEATLSVMLIVLVVGVYSIAFHELSAKVHHPHPYKVDKLVTHPKHGRLENWLLRDAFHTHSIIDVEGESNDQTSYHAAGNSMEELKHALPRRFGDHATQEEAGVSEAAADVSLPAADDGQAAQQAEASEQAAEEMQGDPQQEAQEQASADPQPDATQEEPQQAAEEQPQEAAEAATGSQEVEAQPQEEALPQEA